MACGESRSPRISFLLSVLADPSSCACHTRCHSTTRSRSSSTRRTESARSMRAICSTIRCRTSTIRGSLQRARCASCERFPSGHMRAWRARTRARSTAWCGWPIAVFTSCTTTGWDTTVSGGVDVLLRWLLANLLLLPSSPCPRAHTRTPRPTQRPLPPHRAGQPEGVLHVSFLALSFS